MVALSGCLIGVLLTIHLSDATVHLNVNPSSFEPGFSRSLDVNCSFSLDQIPNFSNVISLIISKFDSNNPQTPQEIASINAFNANHGQTNASVSGQISYSGDSFLNLYWAYPSEREAGRYRCEVFGMDKTGHPIQLSSEAKVEVTYLDLSRLIDVLRDLQLQLDTVESRFNDFSNTMTARLETSKNALFHVSSEFKGRRYLLSKHNLHDADVAEAQCELYGAFLAEIDNQEENSFIQHFAGNFSEVTCIMTGGTDEGQEGVWVNRYSGRPMNFTDWYPGEPGTGRYDCLTQIRVHAWKMFDVPCYDSSYHCQFVCELP